MHILLYICHSHKRYLICFQVKTYSRFNLKRAQTKLSARAAQDKSASADTSAPGPCALDDSPRPSLPASQQPPPVPRQQHQPPPAPLAAVSSSRAPAPLAAVRSQGSIQRPQQQQYPRQRQAAAQSSSVEYARSLLERTVTFLLGALEKRHLEFLPCLGNLLVEAVSELFHAARLPPAASCAAQPAAAPAAAGHRCVRSLLAQLLCSVCILHSVAV